MKTMTYALALSVSLLALGANAADLVIGSSTEPSAIDPQFSRTGNNQNIAMQIFDRLVQPDAKLGISPSLAESYKNIDPTTWVVKLRDGVKFHDGKPVTSEDVIYSMTRAKDVPNSPAPFSGNVSAIASMKAIDSLTVEFKTKAPSPDFMDQVGFVYIMQKAISDGKPITEFNNGNAAIGSGPYKFKEWVPGGQVVLEKNAAYWGKKPEFDKVTIKFISNTAARVAALRSGAVDIIDAVTPEDAATLSAAGGIKLHSIPSARLIYLALDMVRDETPFVTDAAGKPLTPNPLKKLEVRQALAKMVNAQLIVDRIVGGAGQVAAQLAPVGVAGSDPTLKQLPYNLNEAKKMLADAGYPNGFGITIHSSNDRFPGDGDVAQALGQMFARGGLKVNGVVTQPYNVYAGNASKQSFSAFVFSIGTTTPTTGNNLRNVFMTADKDAGTGSFNRIKYSNPAYDAKVKEALSEFDTAKRDALLREATKMVFSDLPVIPLYWPTAVWASKDTIEYEANMSEDTSAALASLKK
ncbi:ABC transporter substrate-binding protein [Lacibacterium aquatile]|uniref:ABC transporter substrate-binding protein n=1 Tax=Lacibacterium aquatile TaxID=1168082 RepID=A0ABW5DS98_9PROT